MFTKYLMSFVQSKLTFNWSYMTVCSVYCKAFNLTEHTILTAQADAETVSFRYSDVHFTFCKLR